MDHLEGFLCPEKPQHHTRLCLSLPTPLSWMPLRWPKGVRTENSPSEGQGASEQPVFQRGHCGGRGGGGNRLRPEYSPVRSVGTQPKELWQWGLQVGLGEGKGGCADPDMRGGGCQHRPAPHPEVDTWWVGLGVSLARWTQAKGWMEPTKAGTDLVLSTKNDAQLGSCKLSFIWGKMRTAAWEAALQTALRDCSKEAVCVCVCVSLSRVQLFATPWTITLQAPLSMGFSRQEYWSTLPLPSPKERQWGKVNM